MTGGTVNISRGLWDDAAFADEPFSEREAWVWIICEASWKPRERRIGKLTVRTERGQFAGSVRFMSDAWKWSKSRVHRFLKRLENRDMLRTDSGTGILIVTVCKYDEYQAVAQASGTAAGHIAGQQRDSSGTNEKKGEIRGEEGLVEEAGASSGKQAAKSTKSRRACRLPDGWAPSDRNEADALEIGLRKEDVDREAAKFRDYWCALSGAKAAKLDWDATWRNWCRNANSRMALRAVPGGSRSGGGIAGVVARRRLGDEG